VTVTCHPKRPSRSSRSRGWWGTFTSRYAVPSSTKKTRPCGSRQCATRGPESLEPLKRHVRGPEGEEDHVV